jgi:hypothetical protein
LSQSRNEDSEEYREESIESELLNEGVSWFRLLVDISFLIRSLLIDSRW